MFVFYVGVLFTGGVQRLNNQILYSVLMLLAGIGIPTMAALSGNLGNKLGSPALAVTILLIVALSIAVCYLLITEGIPTELSNANTQWYLYFAGAFFVFYILSITWVAPKFGISNAVSFVLLGQLIAMTIIDQYALFGAQQVTVDLKRVIGLLFMAIGVFFVIK